MIRAKALAHALRLADQAEDLAAQAARSAVEGWDCPGDMAGAATANATASQAWAMLAELLPEVETADVPCMVIHWEYLTRGGERLIPRVPASIGKLTPRTVRGVSRVEINPPRPKGMDADVPDWVRLRSDNADPQWGLRTVNALASSVDMDALRRQGVEIVDLRGSL